VKLSTLGGMNRIDADSTHSSGVHLLPDQLTLGEKRSQNQNVLMIDTCAELLGYRNRSLGRL